MENQKVGSVPRAKNAGPYSPTVHIAREGSPGHAALMPTATQWHLTVANFPVTFLIPLLGLLLWIAHSYFTLSGNGPQWARWGARLGCLALVPLAIVATYYWWFSFVPRPVHPHFSDRRPVDVYAMVNIFVGLLAWAMFAVLEPLLMGLGVRLERRRNRLRPQGEPVAPQAS